MCGCDRRGSVPSRHAKYILKIYVSNVSFLTILIFTPKKFPNGKKIWDTGRRRPLVGLVVVVFVINAVAQLVSVIVVVSSSFFSR